jgi:hypothetical protein
MSRIASRKPIDDLELNLSAFANKLPTHWQAKQSNRRGESSVVRKEDVMRFYVSEDVENDVRRCITSWEHQHSISVTGRTEAGELKCFSGTVEAVARAPGLATGELWLITMRESKPTPGLFDAGVGTAANALDADLKWADPVYEHFR